MSAPRLGGGLLYLRGLPSDPAVVARLAPTDAGFRIPVHRAVGARAMDAAVAEGGCAVPAGFLRLSQPRLVVLADDHPDARGPDGWPQAPELLAWCRSCVLHAAAGDPGHYAMVAAATVLHRRVLLVEMEFRHMPAWMRLARRELPRLNLLRIEPPPGGTHPVLAVPAGVSVQ